MSDKSPFLLKPKTHHILIKEGYDTTKFRRLVPVINLPLIMYLTAQ